LVARGQYIDDLPFSMFLSAQGQSGPLRGQDFVDKGLYDAGIQMGLVESGLEAEERF
jgi:hypothetical protein